MYGTIKATRVDGQASPRGFLRQVRFYRHAATLEPLIFPGSPEIGMNSKNLEALARKYGNYAIIVDEEKK